MKITPEWLKNKIESGDDGECEAGFELTSKSQIKRLNHQMKQDKSVVDAREWVSDYDKRILPTCDAVEIIKGLLSHIEQSRQWIKVEDKLPEDGQKVFAYNEVTGIYLTKFNSSVSGKEWPMRGWGEKGGTWFPQPECWQPLPSPPKED